MKKYQEQYKDVPNQFAADAYDCIYAIYNALVKSNATPDMDAVTLRGAQDCLHRSDFTYSGLTGENMTRDASGAVTKEPKGMVIQNGAYVGMD